MMADKLKLGSFEIFWLDGGVFELDGGCMFGVVPRALWQKKFPCRDDGFVKLSNTPILVRTMSAEAFVRRAPMSFDVVYADPPFAYRYKSGGL